MLVQSVFRMCEIVLYTLHRRRVWGGGGLRGFSPPPEILIGSPPEILRLSPPPDILQQLTHQSPFTNYRLLVSIGVEYGGASIPREFFLYGLAPQGFWLFMNDRVTG